MELSEVTLKGLESIQDRSVIGDDVFNEFVDVVGVEIVKKSDGKNMTKFYDLLKPSIVNSAFADVTSLFVEAARHKYDAESLTTYLHTHKLFGSRTEKLCETYRKHRDSLILHLASIGNSLPCVIDVDWRLDYCIKSSTDNEVSKEVYHIRLSTKKQNNIDYVQFTCSLHQLQELVYKLKDAARHIEKLSSN